MPLFTTAYAGSGKLDKELAAHNLDQLLPDNLGMVYIPEGEIPRRKFPGLSGVVEWLTKEVGTEGTIPVPDLIEALIKRREAEEDDVALVLVHDPDSESDVALARAAHEAGIRVIDLTKAGNDMLFEDEPEEAPPFDTEEAADDLSREDRPPTLDETLAKAESPGAAVARAAAAGLAAASARQPAGPPLSLTIVLPVGQDFIDAMADAIVRSMGRQAEASVERASLTSVATGEAVAPVIPIGTTGAPGSGDVAGQPPGTSVYYYNEENATYRPARGKARAGETRVYLTADDIKEAREKGLLG